MASKKKTAKKATKKKKKVLNLDGSVRKKPGRKKTSTKKAPKKKPVAKAPKAKAAKLSTARLRAALKGLSYVQLKGHQMHLRHELNRRDFARKESEFYTANPDFEEERKKNPAQFDLFRASLRAAIGYKHNGDPVVLGSYLRQMLMNPATAGVVVLEINTLLGR